MRLLARHPHLDQATTSGAITISWAREIAGWTGRIDPQELQSQADQILVEAAAVTAVLESLGKNRGPEDLRTIGQRYHDALQEACELLIRARMVPDRAGADTRVDVVIPLCDLLGMDGASVVEDTWLRARAGEHGYLSGADAEAVACDALIVPVVTGSPRWELISEMITLVTDGMGLRTPARRVHPRPQPRRQDHPPQPRTTTNHPTHRIAPHPANPGLGLPHAACC
jgi:hypothetical protein